MPPAADEVCEVIITAPDPDWLVEFTRRLVTDRLCASGHNFAAHPHHLPLARPGPRQDRGPSCPAHPPQPPAADHRPRQAGAPLRGAQRRRRPDHRRRPRLPRLDPGTDRTTGLSRAASSSRGGSLVLPPRPGSQLNGWRAAGGWDRGGGDNGTLRRHLDPGPSRPAAVEQRIATDHESLHHRPRHAGLRHRCWSGLGQGPAVPGPSCGVTPGGAFNRMIGRPEVGVAVCLSLRPGPGRGGPG